MKVELAQTDIELHNSMISIILPSPKEMDTLIIFFFFFLFSARAAAMWLDEKLKVVFGISD